MQRDLDKMRRRPCLFPRVLAVRLLIAVGAGAAGVLDARAPTVMGSSLMSAVTCVLSNWRSYQAVFCSR